MVRCNWQLPILYIDDMVMKVNKSFSSDFPTFSSWLLECPSYILQSQIFDKWLSIITNHKHLNVFKHSQHSQWFPRFFTIINNDDNLNVLKHENDSNDMGGNEYELNWHPVQGLPLDLSEWWLLVKMIYLRMMIMMWNVLMARGEGDLR